jgi:hypothetical protein
MKVGQKSIIRWVAKLVAKEPRGAQHKAGSELRTLSADQLRQVSGGTGTNTGSPNKGW